MDTVCALIDGAFVMRGTMGLLASSRKGALTIVHSKGSARSPFALVTQAFKEPIVAQLFARMIVRVGAPA